MNKNILRLQASTLIMAFALSGCNGLPRSGPDDGAIERGAAIKVTTTDKKVGIDYVLMDINSNILNSFSQPVAASIRDSFGGGRGGPPNIPLGVGDVVQVAVFEAQAGGLFIPAEAGARPGNFITLPSQTIDRSGTISVPYAGKVRAAGRSKEAVEKDIEDQLANRAIEPQVVITSIASHSSEVAVLGDVNKAAKIEVTVAGERVLDVISAAEGISTPSKETYITLQRGGRTATISYETLQNTPAENIYVAPGDTILVNRERRTYIAFGASGLNGRFDFQETNLTLSEAIGQAGGLLDDRADPGQVILYRSVDKKTLQRLGIDVSHFVSSSVPVIFRANLRDPAAFFAIQKFAMQDKDILYVSNSDSVEILKVFGFVESVTGSSAGVTNDVQYLRDTRRNLSN